MRELKYVAAGITSLAVASYVLLRYVRPKVRRLYQEEECLW